MVVVLLAATGLSPAGTIEIGWDSVAGAAGYRVYLGTASGNYNTSIDVGQATTTSLGNLGDCTTYYVAVKAYNQAGQSPGFSNEVTGWARPELSSQTLTAMQGEQLVLGIDGANFESGAEVTIDEAAIPNDVYGNPLILFGSFTVRSCHHAEALVRVEPSVSGLQAMGLGELALPIEVVNPDGAFRSRSVPLEILFNESRADVNRTRGRTTDRVDGDDLATLARSWASDYGDPLFEFGVDLDGDTDVDGDDLALLAGVFGRCRSAESWTVAACGDDPGS